MDGQSDCVTVTLDLVPLCESRGDWQIRAHTSRSADAAAVATFAAMSASASWRSVMSALFGRQPSWRRMHLEVGIGRCTQHAFSTQTLSVLLPGH